VSLNRLPLVAVIDEIPNNVPVIVPLLVHSPPVPLESEFRFHWNPVPVPAMLPYV
jgi:hypothetical protein